MWILKANVAVGCHLVYLALEEVSLDVAVRGRMAAVIVFLHESFQFIGSRDAPIVSIEFLHLADEVFGEFHVEVRVLVDAHIVHVKIHSHFLLPFRENMIGHHKTLLHDLQKPAQLSPTQFV